MKKTWKRISALLLLVLLAAMPATAFAAGSSVTFKGLAQGFAFESGSGYTPTDLFGNFKNVMPGDVLEESISFKNTATDCDYIKVYLKALVHDESGNPLSYSEAFENADGKDQADVAGARDETVATMQDFLRQLSVTVYNGGTAIYSGKLDQLGSLADHVYLGTLNSGESLQCRVVLSVPIDLDNKYANRVGEVDWLFTAEGFGNKIPTPYDEETSRVAHKIWIDSKVGRPESITVQLIGNGKVVDEQQLNDANQWTYTWQELDPKTDWLIVEKEVPAGYAVSYHTEGCITFITNTKGGTVVPGEPEKLTVTKRWNDNDNPKRPSYVKISLLQGKDVVETVYLGAWNDWTYTWNDLDGSYHWQAMELDPPRGYVPGYAKKDNVVVVTNSTALIQTGQLNWPIPVLGGLGLLLVISGLVMLRKKRREDRA